MVLHYVNECQMFHTFYFTVYTAKNSKCSNINRIIHYTQQPWHFSTKDVTKK